MRYSVIIPVYNVADWLPACLDSVLEAARRTTDGVELICVDDGSTDGSGAILDRYAAIANGTPGVEMRVLHRANGGVGAARNAGLETASGDWMLFVDGDDFVRDTWLSDLSNAIDRCDADLIGFGKMPFFGTEQWNELSAEYEDIGIERSICDRLVGYCVYQFAYSAALVGGMRFGPYSVGEDLVFTAQAFARARRCVLTDRQDYGYRFREGSAMHSSCSTAKMLDAIRFNVDMFGVLAASGKAIGDAFSHGRGDEWLVSLPRMILARRKEPGGREVLDAWFDSLSFAAACACLSAGRRAMAGRIARRRTVFAVLWFCLLPAWLNRRFRRFSRHNRKVT